MTKEVLKMALETLEQLDGIDTETECVTIDVGDVIDAIEEALAQPEQEPVAFICEFYADAGHPFVSFEPVTHGTNTPLYTTPPQRKPQEFVCSTGLCHYRKPLTNDRAHQILLDMAKHIETFGDENITEQALSAECIRFILERVTAYGIKEEV